VPKVEFVEKKWLIKMEKKRIEKRGLFLAYTLTL